MQIDRMKWCWCVYICIWIFCCKQFAVNAMFYNINVIKWKTVRKRNYVIVSPYQKCNACVNQPLFFISKRVYGAFLPFAIPYNLNNLFFVLFFFFCFLHHLRFLVFKQLWDMNNTSLCQTKREKKNNKMRLTSRRKL